MFINLIAPISHLGYGVVGYSVLKGLHRNGHTVGYFPIGEPKWDGDPEAKEIVNNAIKNGFVYDNDAPCVRIWHQHELDKFVGKGERIGWPIFELDKFTERELHQLNSVDRLFVCSQWAKQVLQKNNIDIPINVIPLGVDTNTFYVDENDKKSRPYWTKDTTVFINVGKWEVRKGHNELCEAFAKAFEDEDNVELWMMNENPFINTENETWKRKYVEKLGNKVRIIERVKTQTELKRIFNHVDFGVFPSHAEGWNLEVLELMACGAGIIATNYSGHTEFLSKDNALLLEPNGMQPAVDGRWFHGQGEWCSFNIDELVALLRQAHELKQADINNNISGGMDRMIFGSLDTAKKFTWDNTVKEIEKAL